MAGIEVFVLDRIASKLLGYATDRGVQLVDTKLTSKRQQKAREAVLRNALAKAYDHFAQKHPTAVANGFDGSFLEQEAIHILGEFLVPDGETDPTSLAVAWAKSLDRRSGERQISWIRQLEPSAADFLSLFGSALKAEADLRDINWDRALDQIASSMHAIEASIGANKATAGTRLDYLNWLISRNLYLDTRGTLQTQRQVQLKLEDVYVSLEAQREFPHALVDRRIPERGNLELAEVNAPDETDETPAEEIEEQPAFLLASLEDKYQSPDILELSELLRRYEHAVILGDPGSGKTTLLSYLALKHAQASLYGLPEAANSLGPTHFPILVRMADYVESSGWKGTPLSEFLYEACWRHECPNAGLRDLLLSQLDRGNCLVLLDGLDEVVNTDDRLAVVKQVEDFFRRYRGNGNRFVVTSRRAGYRSAPIQVSFAHYAIRDMNETHVRRFLEQWCPAVEAAETPELAPEVRGATARREIESIMKAMRTNPGVRRLTANPLLLRILALIHRAGAQLPQKRIELYRLAAETLAATWRVAMGVPQTSLELLRDEYLTPLLGKLAYWIHIHRPTGVATEADVLNLLAPEWAQLSGVDWDEDNPNLRVIEQAKSFLQSVREHTGLFVERAPRRYGFMHLTFEEYYAARHLVARSKTRPALIRKHLHDPRWLEPILLGIGFVGLESATEAAELLQTAILARGEDADRLGYHPSEDEDLLGRDYLFALRCLGDNIPAHPSEVTSLVSQLLSDLLQQSGRSRYWRFQQAVYGTLPYLADSRVSPRLFEELLNAARASVPERRAAAIRSLAGLERQSPDVIKVLIEATTDEVVFVQQEAVQALGEIGEYTPEIILALISALQSDAVEVRIDALWSLSVFKQEVEELPQLLLKAISDDDPYFREAALRAVGLVGKSTPEIIAALVEATDAKEWFIRRMAINSLALIGQPIEEVIAALIKAATDRKVLVRNAAIYRLKRLAQEKPELTDIVARTLIATYKDKDIDRRRAAVWSLGALGEVTPEIIATLVTAVEDHHALVGRVAIRSLGQLGETSPDVVARLVSAIENKAYRIRQAAAWSLGQLGVIDPRVVERLIDATRDQKPSVREAAVRSLGQVNQPLPHVGTSRRFALEVGSPEEASISPERENGVLQVLSRIRECLIDSNPDVRCTAAISLARLLGPTPEVGAHLTEILSRYTVSAPIQREATDILAQVDPCIEEIIDVLLLGTAHWEHIVSRASVRGLVSIARRDAIQREVIVQKLRLGLSAEMQPGSPEVLRSEQSLLYDALWMIQSGEKLPEYG